MNNAEVSGEICRRNYNFRISDDARLKHPTRRVFLSLVQFWHIRESGLRSQRDCYLARAKFWQRNCGAVRRMGRRRGFAAKTVTRAKPILPAK